MSERDMLLHGALEATEAGHAIVLCRYGTKAAADKGWQNTRLMSDDIRFRFESDLFNIAARVHGLCVFDKDARSRETYNFLRKHRIKSPMEVQTSKGVHVWMRLAAPVGDVRTRIRFMGMPLDVKLTGCVMLPPSLNAETGRYYQYRDGKRLLPPGELPPVPDSVIELLAEDSKRRRKGVQRAPINQLDGARTRLIRRATNYISRIIAEAGNKGHNACFRAVCRLRDFGLTAEEAWGVLVAWNEQGNAIPPFDEQALRHKHESVFKT